MAEAGTFLGEVERGLRRFGAMSWPWKTAWAAMFTVIVAGSTLFLFGETIFGSSRATIDQYNRDALEGTDLYPGSVQVQVRVRETTVDGTVVRLREELYATPDSSSDVREFYVQHPPSRLRGVTFALMPPRFRWPDDPGVETLNGAAVPAETTFVLVAGQRYVDGWF
jgi:hypothetical protein